MKVDRKLNLVVPIERPEGVIYVHAAPISREVYERHFLVMAKTHAAIFDQGLHFTAGPRVAALMLRQYAEKLGVWDGPDGVQVGLMAEIRRLSNVIAPTGKGYGTLPLDVAVSQGQIDEDEVTEVESEIVFFTLECCLRKKAQLPIFLVPMHHLCGSSSTSLDATAFAASLKISTPAEPTGVKVKASSIAA